MRFVYTFVGIMRAYVKHINIDCNTRVVKMPNQSDNTGHFGSGVVILLLPLSLLSINGIAGRVKCRNKFGVNNAVEKIEIARCLRVRHYRADFDRSPVARRPDLAVPRFDVSPTVRTETTTDHRWSAGHNFILKFSTTIRRN